MGKIKIEIGLGKWSEYPLSDEDYKKVEIEQPFDTAHASPRIMDVSIKEVYEDAEASNNGFLINQEFTIITTGNIDNLVSRLLTYVEATYTDKEQREAHKKLLRRAAWDWYNAYSPEKASMIND